MLGFRVWDNDEKKMLNLEKDNFIHGLASDPKGCLVYADLSDDLEDGILTEAESFGSYIPMQSTGMMDKNEKVIFEGDIVSINVVYEDDTREVINYVVHHSIAAALDFEHMGCRTYSIIDDFKGFYEFKISGEIIGNKYESPELLERLK